MWALSSVWIQVYLSIAVAIVFFCAVFAWNTWEDLQVRIARYSLFKARDSIFFLFARSHLGVDHPTHRDLLDRLNVLIRHAHRITIFRLFAWRKLKHLDGPSVSDAMDRLPAGELRDRVRLEYERAQRTLLWLLVARSPILWLTVQSARVIPPLRRIFSNGFLFYKAKADTADDYAFAIENEERVGGMNPA